MLGHRLRRAPYSAPPGGASVTHVATATSSSGSITIPSSAQAGDLAVLFDESANLYRLGTVSNVVPTGFTLLKYLSPNSAVKYNASYKILVSGDPGSSITGMNDTYDSKVLFVFRLASGAITTVTVAYNDGYTTTGNPTDMTAPAGTEPYVVVAGVAGGTDTGANWTSLTPAADGSQLQKYLRAAYWLFSGTAGTDVAAVMGDWGSHTEVSLHALEVS